MASTRGESSYESDSIETEQLLNNSRSVGPRKKRHSCRFPYRLIKITGKGAVFMILYNILFATILLDFYESALKFQYPSIEHSKISQISLSIFGLLCPSIGLVSVVMCYVLIV